MTISADSIDRSGWPHVAALALACATFPLIWVGGLVTTYDAGMSVPDWPTTYGYNMFLYPWQSWVSGPWDLFIEHGHRLLGALVGLLTIAVNAAIWKYDSRGWLRGLAVLALVLVIGQGVLGGMRVRMASTGLARLHGCTGPLFFALTCVLCTATSRFWFSTLATEQRGLTKTNVLASWMFFALAYLQLILGSHLRHPEVHWSPRAFQSVVTFHVVLAIVLVVSAVTIASRSWSLTATLKRPAWILLLLVCGQFVLGFATWRAKYGWPSFLPVLAEAQMDQPAEIAAHRALMGGTVQAESMTQALTVTGHVALGSLILVAGVWYASRLSRSYSVQQRGRVATESTSSRQGSGLGESSRFCGLVVQRETLTMSPTPTVDATACSRLPAAVVRGSAT